MYQLFVILQYIGISMGLVNIVWILKQPKSKYQAILLGMMLSVFLNNLGYLFELKADSKELAVQALKFTYFGKSFAPFLLMLFIVSYSRLRIPKIVTCILASVHCSILVMVETCEYNSLFYKSIGYTHTGMFPHLVLGHGLFYKLYTLLLICYLMAVPVYCMIKTKKDLDLEEHHILVHLSEIMIIMGLGFALFLTGVTRGYDSTALAYVISESILLHALVRENMLETLAVAKDYVADNIAQGLVIVDKNSRLLYHNEAAAQIFPQLMSKKTSSVINEIISLNKGNALKFVSENVYKTSRRCLIKGKTSICTIYVLENITSEYYYADRLKRNVDIKTKEIARMQRSVIASFAAMVEARDGNTGQHVKRTSEYVGILAQSLRDNDRYRDLLDEQTIQMITDAAPLHDIGKISIPDAILTKPGKLTDEEFSIIQTHSAVGANIIKDTLKDIEHADYLRVAMDMAHYHHEKWDGSGYPSGLSGNDIPLAARIMAVADVYDALCSKRSYKKAFSNEKAYGIIIDGRGHHFDPDIVDAFTKGRAQIECVSRQ